MRRRFSLRPRSVPGLVLACFVVVVLPLVVAVIFGVVYVNRLTHQSERLVLQGVQVTRYSKQLAGDITAMERNMRQYAVLADPSLANSFDTNARSFEQTLGNLRGLHLDTVPRWNLKQVRAQVETLTQAIANSDDGQGLKQHFGAFDDLRASVKNITDQGNLFIDNELTNLQQTSREARSFLWLCVFTLIPAVILLTIAFTYLLSRPISQLRGAMRQLGREDFKQQISISAPSIDLDSLGRQLDWVRRRLAALEAEKNQFLRHMSHELKTPLAGLHEGVALFRDGTLGTLSERQAEVTDILHRNCRELTALIDNLLNFAQWQQRRAHITPSTIDLRELTEQIVARHQLGIEKRAVQVELAMDNVDLHADRDQMRLVLDNLLGNALRFSPQGGRLRVAARQTREHCIIDISDEGPGIPEDEREHIFAPFYQTDNTPRGHLQGSGIGLSVVHEAIRAHRGEIRVLDSKRGAHFRIILPQQAQPGESR